MRAAAPIAGGTQRSWPRRCCLVAPHASGQDQNASSGGAGSATQQSERRRAVVGPYSGWPPRKPPVGDCGRSLSLARCRLLCAWLASLPSLASAPLATSLCQRRVADAEVRRTSAGPDSSAAHSLMRALLREKDRKCHTTIESWDTSWRNDSVLPLQILRWSRARMTLRRTSRPRDSQRG